MTPRQRLEAIAGIIDSWGNASETDESWENDDEFVLGMIRDAIGEDHAAEVERLRAENERLVSEVERHVNSDIGDALLDYDKAAIVNAELRAELRTLRARVAEMERDARLGAVVREAEKTTTQLSYEASARIVYETTVDALRAEEGDRDE